MIGAAGIAESPLQFQQMKACPLLMAWERRGVQAHQHDRPVGDGSHRLQGAHGEGAAAMAKPAAVCGERFLQHLDHHSHIQLQGAIRCLLLPGVQALLDRLPFPVPISTVEKQILEQVLQTFHPHRAWRTDA